MSVVTLRYEHKSSSGKITFRDDEGIFDHIVEVTLEVLSWVAIEAPSKSSRGIATW